jgi:HSP20 family protein
MFELIPFTRRSDFWDPFKELDDMEKRFNKPAPMAFRTDVKETDEAYILEAELPGFSKENIAIDVDDNYLTITAERKTEKNDESNKNYIRRERSYGSFTRSFDITGIDNSAISAKYTDGILELTLPKQKIEEPEKRRLQID